MYENKFKIFLINILMKKHSKYKVLLSGYGKSNQINSLTGRY